AVTNEPGLIGSVLVGLMAAKTLAWTWGLPLIGVNHVYAHAVAAGLDGEPVEYPAVALICSGGHTALYRCQGPTRMSLLGTTIDDAAGEAFDKAAKILHLSYPGGPAIQKAAETGDETKVPFPRSLLRGGSLDFSFSGLKTALLYHVNGVPGAQGRHPRRQAGPTRLRHETQPHAGEGIERFTPQEIADVAASFQAAVVDALRIKLRRACEAVGAKTIILGGGVAANAALRKAVTALAEKLRIPLRLPKLAYCLDNAAMVAALGYYHLKEGKVDTLELEANATVRG
ncbi:MAG: tRNA (adenosine(37)-N6)-threonylcarbamoyltransferase complex transferase subunit TsaD, partial [Planctomycetota bacterium]|nr:tRNA (adenosine(37)-N6)-threonylcarbamoyltransferase complex transferase subunit TsaD [Planctomycetota bacterium]